MTAHPARGSEETLKPIHELFRSGVNAFWATTYSVDLHLSVAVDKPCGLRPVGSGSWNHCARRGVRIVIDRHDLNR
jgi:hypothetical protein